MDNYIPCEVCKCEDCYKGTHRSGSWYCPVLEKQICDVCCHYDTKSELGLDCLFILCEHYNE
jgi:hypothetical protein